MAEDALARIYKPSQGWVNWEDCGIEFTCTGLYNAVLRFENAQFSGATIPDIRKRTFNIVSNNEESISVQAGKD